MGMQKKTNVKIPAFEDFWFLGFQNVEAFFNKNPQSWVVTRSDALGAPNTSDEGTWHTFVARQNENPTTFYPENPESSTYINFCSTYLFFDVLEMDPKHFWIYTYLHRIGIPSHKQVCLWHLRIVFFSLPKNHDPGPLLHDPRTKRMHLQTWQRKKKRCTSLGILLKSATGESVRKPSFWRNIIWYVPKFEGFRINFPGEQNDVSPIRCSNPSDDESSCGNLRMGYTRDSTCKTWVMCTQWNLLLCLCSVQITGWYPSGQRFLESVRNFTMRSPYEMASSYHFRPEI